MPGEVLDILRLWRSTPLQRASRLERALECMVCMIRASFEQKPYRRVIMETWDGSVVPSPIDEPDRLGSLGTAISQPCSRSHRGEGGRARSRARELRRHR